MSNAKHIDDALKPRPDPITVKNQLLAADPKMSAWVSANAGSGKTYVLSTRVIRLLLGGVEPSKILCLTYTKTAAAEMKNRVFSRLGEWVTMESDALAKALIDINDKVPSEAEITFARTLFAKALETPGGLKIQTIHAFCEALLHRFPLEANIAGHFELVDDIGTTFLIAEARRQLLTGRAGETRGAIQRVLSLKGESGLESLLSEIISKRQKLGSLIETLGDTAERRTAYLKAYNFKPEDTVASIQQSIWHNLPIDKKLMRSVRDEAAAMGKSRAYEFAYACIVAFDTGANATGFEQLKDTLLSGGTKAYKSSWLFAKDILVKFPTLAEKYEQAADIMLALVDRTNLLAEIEQTLDALQIADHLLTLYARLKNRRGLLDFEDLITRTENMLMKDNVSAWVRYKLDQGIDHILVDEAQDTSPAQWRVIKTLADEFFSGEGARDVTRTMFAVGDEKQSIYSFQGADPREFGTARDHFDVAVHEAESTFNAIRLEVSFRSTEDVLSAVDKVFAYVDHKRGVSPADSILRHQSLRENQAGEVEVWECENAVKTEQEEDWRQPVDHAQKPAVILANRIAKRIKDWLDSAECLAANGKKIDAGDVLVLVRKRDAFVHALSLALKDLKVPVAGADRLAMTAHIAILDLMALGRIMLNKADDLSLAALLRSPLFGWSDDQLFDLSNNRGELSLYEALQLSIADHAHCAAAYVQLEKWRSVAINKPVFEFYSHVLGVSGARAQLIGRLGPETGDMLDEFLNYAIAQERTGPVSLETFLNALDNFAPEIKREMDGKRTEVRIMTVHGAKGLEAPIVFLVDPGSPAFTAKSAPLLLPAELSDGLFKPINAVLWGGSSEGRSRHSAEIIDVLKERAEEEYRRLLYVGMTRAADRLIICGYAGVNGGKEGTWLAMAKKGLEEHSRPHDFGDYQAIIYPAVQTLPIHPPRDVTIEENPTLVELPDCFTSLAPSEPPATRPLFPSGASGLAIEADRQDSDGEKSISLLEQYEVSGRSNAMDPALALKWGVAVHKMLQMLPNIETSSRYDRARAYCHHVDARWTDDDIDTMCNQVFAVLDNSAYSPFFTSSAHAEVSVMGTIMINDEERAVSGVIDRLSVTEDSVYILDYKTNANPPTHMDEIPAVYLRQMALYQALVAPLYPAKKVKAALLFTAKSQLFVLDDKLLSDALRTMKTG